MIYKELKGKKYRFLVTGGAGFIGSNLAIALLENAQSVIVLDNFSTGRKKNIEDVRSFTAERGIHGSEFRLIDGDIRSLASCMEAGRGVDFILHNAALGSVPRSIDDPVTSSEVNVMGAVNMLVSAKENKVKRFVYASSSSVYGDSEKLPKAEGEEGSPLSPYALTKRVGEEYAENFRRVYGLDSIGLRYFNVFGPRQDPDSRYAAVIPLFVKKLLSKESPTINGDGETTRDFTYVENVVSANILAALAAPSPSMPGVYNIACSKPVSLNAVYKKIATLLGTDIKPVYGPERKGDVRHSDADISKAKEFLRYEPSVGFEKGLELSMEWYKKNI
ncbi:MAG: SDR family oxidoreductase [Thermodesulfobacteriota bacterium]